MFHFKQVVDDVVDFAIICVLIVVVAVVCIGRLWMSTVPTSIQANETYTS